MSFLVLGKIYSFSTACLCTLLLFCFLKALVASFQLENPSTVNNRSQLPFDTVFFFVISALQQVEVYGKIHYQY